MLENVRKLDCCITSPASDAFNTSIQNLSLLSTKMANALGAVYKLAVPIAIGLTFAQASIYDVKGGSRAVIFDRLAGVKDQVMNEGTHFLIPWLQKSIIYDVRTKPRNISTTTGSKDLQMVSLTLRVLHRPEVKMLPKIYQVSPPSSPSPVPFIHPSIPPPPPLSTHPQPN